jgi:guanosine-3',5'-bis(diphosphate) 3'-pyrophosphohydrolase
METFLKSIPHNFTRDQQELLSRALAFARQAHAGQKRKSGEEFVEHPIEAAIILGRIFPDPTTIVALLLHDIPEDTKIPLEEIKKEFGAEVARLVDGVTKLGHVRLRNSKDKFYVENLRKMFIATSQDIRVMIIKLADRLHNMRTIKFLPEDKQVKIATETLEIFAPIAGRLGIGAWKDELEDLAFHVAYPDDYAAVKKQLDDELQSHDKNIKNMQKQLGQILHLEGIKFLDTNGRTKRVYSLFNKLKKYEGDITKIYDLIAFRIITKSSADCYAALGVIHKHFQPVPGRVKDFIAIPKPNGYQSLHTSVFDKFGKVFEIQIRTDLMDEEAERGIAAHWFYTEQGKSDNLQRHGSWFKELRAWQEDVTNPEEYLESLRIDFFQDRIFVLTPKGDVKDLPVGASVIDFAFSVHSDLGYFMLGAKINGKIASIYDELHKGDVVQILKTKKPATISRDWLASARTSHARGQIRKYLAEHDRGLMSRVRELKLQNKLLPRFMRKQ